MSDVGYCYECGQRVADDEYHPYLYCLLFKAAKIEDQAAYLAAYGFERRAEGEA